MTPETEGLWRWQDVAVFLGLKRSATLALIAASDIPCVYPNGKSRRFVPEEVRAWFLKQRKKGETQAGAQLTHPDSRTRGLG
jgi:hypothetical protein